MTSQTNELLASYRVLAVSGMLLSALDVPTPEQAIVVEKTWLQGIGVTN